MQVAIVAGEGAPESIESSRTFKDLGLDSRAAVELRNRLRTATGLRLPAALLFDHPTPAALAERVLRELTGSKLERSPARVSKLHEEPIAIVGMSCRYPGAASFTAGALGARGRGRRRDLRRSRPIAGWDLDGLYDPDPDQPGTSYAREGGFVLDAADFDAAFFGIGPREALAMDPQQRLLLEASWEALEDAGIDPGVAAGQSDGRVRGRDVPATTAAASTAPRPPASRVTWGPAAPAALSPDESPTRFGLEGPAVSVDTACSSSLVALHWACQALRGG